MISMMINGDFNNNIKQLKNSLLHWTVISIRLAGRGSIIHMAAKTKYWRTARDKTDCTFNTTKDGGWEYPCDLRPSHCPEGPEGLVRQDQVWGSQGRTSRGGPHLSVTAGVMGETVGRSPFEFDELDALQPTP